MEWEENEYVMPERDVFHALEPDRGVPLLRRRFNRNRGRYRRAGRLEQNDNGLPGENVGVLRWLYNLFVALILFNCPFRDNLGAVPRFDSAPNGARFPCCFIHLLKYKLSKMWNYLLNFFVYDNRCPKCGRIVYHGDENLFFFIEDNFIYEGHYDESEDEIFYQLHGAGHRRMLFDENNSRDEMMNANIYNPSPEERSERVRPRRARSGRERNRWRSFRGLKRKTQKRSNKASEQPPQFPFRLKISGIVNAYQNENAISKELETSVVGDYEINVFGVYNLNVKGSVSFNIPNQPQPGNVSEENNSLDRDDTSDEIARRPLDDIRNVNDLNEHDDDGSARDDNSDENNSSPVVGHNNHDQNKDENEETQNEISDEQKSEVEINSSDGKKGENQNDSSDENEVEKQMDTSNVQEIENLMENSKKQEIEIEMDISDEKEDKNQMNTSDEREDNNQMDSSEKGEGEYQMESSNDKEGENQMKITDKNGGENQNESLDEKEIGNQMDTSDEKENENQVESSKEQEIEMESLDEKEGENQMETSDGKEGENQEENISGGKESENQKGGLVEQEDEGQEENAEKKEVENEKKNLDEKEGENQRDNSDEKEIEDQKERSNDGDENKSSNQDERILEIN